MIRLFLNFLDSSWILACQMSWALIFGYFAAGIIIQLISGDFIRNHLGGRGFWQIFKASLFGVPLPLCSCGVLPFAEGMKKMGTSRGAIVSFLVSTPQTGVDSIFITYKMLGLFFAVFRPVAAFISGVFCGVSVELFAGKDQSQIADKSVPDESCCLCNDTETSSLEEWNSTTKGKNVFDNIVTAFRYGIFTLMGDSAVSIVIGILAGGLINAIIPAKFFELGSGNEFIQMILMMAFGIPLYVCASASVPVASVLIAKGISPGAAFVFLMTGPATNTISFAVVSKIIKFKGMIVYILSLIVSALILGTTVNYFSPKITQSAANTCSLETLTPFQKCGGILFIFLLAAACWVSVSKKKQYQIK